MKRMSLIALLPLLTACEKTEGLTQETGGDTGENSAVEDTQADPAVQIELVTGLGTVVIELAETQAPITTANFLQYVDEGFYDGDDGAGGTLFHRVIPGFMAQGGGLLESGVEKTTRSAIVNESDNGLENMRGTIAMARTNDPHSASSQFFINLKDNDFLNHTSESAAGWGYAVFGKVTEGLETIDEIAKVQTGNVGGHGDVPTEAVTIIKATIEE